MLDQVEAMKFVQEEISNFGGDPNKITIFGESAGGGSVSAHTYSPLSRGLFQQMIAESGAVWTSLDHTSTDIYYLSASRAQVLCNFSKEMWNSMNYTLLETCLMDMEYKKWLPLEQHNVIGWKIVLDGYFMPDWPKNLAKDRPNLPVIVGMYQAFFDSTFKISKNSDFL
uniref:Carboxylic ester hydrolase n=1 Tax=Acrobeloides nanus TaxID=290746 RepID=A0A914DXW3_9BILA